MTTRPGVKSPRILQRLVDLLGRWRNTVFSAADHIWLLFLWVLSTPLFIQVLGPDRFGVWILINAVIGLGGAMSLGFGEATIRYVALYRGRNRLDDVRRIYDTTQSLYALVGVLSGVAIGTAAPVIAQSVLGLTGPQATEAVLALRLAGVALFITAYLKTFEAVINGFERFDLTARVGIATRSFIILGNVALVLMGYSVATLIACAVVGLAGQAAALFVMARRWFVPGLRILCRPDWKTTREIAGFGFQSWLQICAGAINTLADRFLVASMIDPAAAGIYTVSLQLAQQLHLLLSRGLAFMMPATSRTKHDPNGSAELLKSYYRGTTLVLLLVGGLGLPLFVLAPQILHIWVGAEFAAAGTETLRIMTLYFSAWCAGVPIYFLLNGAGRPGWNTAAAMLHSIAGLLLAAMLIPAFGLPGAAFGRLIALPVYFVTLWALHKYVLMGKGMRSSAVMFVWLLVLAAVAWGLAQTTSGLVPATFVGVLGAGAILFLMGICLALVPYLIAQRRTSALLSQDS